MADTKQYRDDETVELQSNNHKKEAIELPPEYNKVEQDDGGDDEEEFVIGTYCYVGCRTVYGVIQEAITSDSFIIIDLSENRVRTVFKNRLSKITGFTDLKIAVSKHKKYLQNKDNSNDLEVEQDIAVNNNDNDNDKYSFGQRLYINPLKGYAKVTDIDDMWITVEYENKYIQSPEKLHIVNDKRQIQTIEEFNSRVVASMTKDDIDDCYVIKCILPFSILSCIGLIIGMCFLMETGLSKIGGGDKYTEFGTNDNCTIKARTSEYCINCGDSCTGRKYTFYVSSSKCGLNSTLISEYELCRDINDKDTPIYGIGETHSCYIVYCNEQHFIWNKPEDVKTHGITLVVVAVFCMLIGIGCTLWLCWFTCKNWRGDKHNITD